MAGDRTNRCRGEARRSRLVVVALLLTAVLAGCVAPAVDEAEEPRGAQATSAERTHLEALASVLARATGSLDRIDEGDELLVAGLLPGAEWATSLRAERSYLGRLGGELRDAVPPPAFHRFHQETVRAVDRAHEGTRLWHDCGTGNDTAICAAALTELTRAADELCDLDGRVRNMMRELALEVAAPVGLCRPVVPGAGPSAHARFDTTAGTFVVELASEMVPETVANFVNLTRAGVYDGTVFHRLARDSFIQGGDPDTRDGDRSTWGLGSAPVAAIRDELHPLLRHDAPGTLSMATAAPDTGRSQFFITLAPMPRLDDRFAVFGRVVEGMAVVQAIGAGAIVGDALDGQPVEPVAITRIGILADPVDPAMIRRGVAVEPVSAEKTMERGRGAVYAVVVQNTGNARDTFTLTASAPSGWSVELESPRVWVPAGTGTVVLLAVTPGPNAASTAEIRVSARSDAEPIWAAEALIKASLGALGPSPRLGDRVEVEWVGLLPDGRVFDTTIQAVAANDGLVKMSSRFPAHAVYAPYAFTVGTGVVPGFSALALDARVGETLVARVAAQDAFVTGNRDDNVLLGRDVVFELRLLGIG